MKRQKKRINETKKRSINRTPEQSVNDAKSNMKTEIKPGVNSEIKDIVDDILKGNLKKVMSSEIGKKIGIKENESNLEEKELILGGASDSSGAQTMSNKSNGIKDITTQGKQSPELQEDEDLDDLDLDEGEVPTINNFKSTADKKVLNTKNPLAEDEDFGIDEDEDTGLEGVEDDVELDLASVGFDVSDEEGEDVPEIDEMSEPLGSTKPEMGLDLGMESEAPTEAPVEAPVEAPAEEAPVESPAEEPETEMDMSIDGDVEGSVDDGDETLGMTIEPMEYGDLSDEDKGIVDESEKEMDNIRSQVTDELAGIDEAILPLKTKEKLAIHFEMLADEKAKILSKKTTATVIAKTNDYMKYVVKEFVNKKSKEIKEANDSKKKARMYTELKGLVESMYGDSAGDLVEAKKTEQFLTNIIAEMKKANTRLERKLNESHNKNEELRFALLFNKETKDMTVTDRARVADFMESFEFKNGTDFKKKLKVVIEKFDNLNSGTVKKTARNSKNIKIDEQKITRAVRKQVINESTNSNDMVEEIKPSEFNMDFY